MTIFNLYLIGILLTFIYLLIKGEKTKILFDETELSGWVKIVGIWTFSIMWPVVVFAMIEQARNGE